MVLVVSLASHVPFVHVPVVGKRQDPLLSLVALHSGSGAYEEHQWFKDGKAYKTFAGFFLAKYGPLQSIKGEGEEPLLGFRTSSVYFSREVGGCKEDWCLVAWVHPCYLTSRLRG